MKTKFEPEFMFKARVDIAGDAVKMFCPHKNRINVNYLEHPEIESKCFDCGSIFNTKAEIGDKQA